MTRSKRILFIYQVPARAGTSGTVQSARRILRILGAEGFALFLLEQNAGLSAGSQVCTEFEGVPCLAYGPTGRPAIDLPLLGDLIRRIVGREKIEILYGHFLVHSGYLAAFWGRSFGLPSVVSIRGNDFDRAIHDPEQGMYVQRALEWCTEAVTVSTIHARQIRRFFPRTSVRFLPNSVARFDSRGVSPLFARENCLLMAGEIKQKKGLDFLLSALPEILPRFPDLTLRVVGLFRSEARQAWVDFKKSYPALAGRLEYLPPLPHSDFQDLLGRVRYVVLPSRFDGLPNLLLEAMAAGCLVIGSSAGGIPDVLKGGRNGVLVPVDQLPWLARYLADTLALPMAHQQKMADQGRLTIRRKFSPETEARKLLKLFRGLPGSREKTT